MIDFSELTPNKVNNGGTTPQGRVSADEWNALVQRVIDNVSAIGSLATATPSGDPLHYMYVALGAVWNATTGYWEMNELTNLSNEDLQIAWNTQYFPLDAMRFLPNRGRLRTNFYIYVGTVQYDARLSGNVLFADTQVEVIKVSAPDAQFYWRATTLERCFRGCSKLRKIIGIMEASSTAGFSNTFLYCSALEEVFIKKLNAPISFGSSPLLNKESLLYVIINAAPTAARTITLHPDVYTWASVDADITAALNAQPLITLVTA